MISNIQQQDKQYIANTYARYEVCFSHGAGALLYDESGKEYIDLGAGIAVNTFGAADAQWKAAVSAQLDRLQHISNLYYTEPQVLLAELLCTRSGMKRVFFGNSGAEANECAIKAARKYADDKYQGARQTIVTLNHSFHGRTLTTLSATGQAQFHQHFHPFTPGFVHAEPGNLAELQTLFDRGDVAALMIELIQGEGGLNVLTQDYVQTAAKLAAERDILLIVDEVQTGNGRTGKLYCFEHYGITPDIVSTAKGLAGGLPFGATLLGEKVQDTLSAGTHGSTFGGNPIAAAGAYNILSRLDGALLQEVTEKGAFIERTLTGKPGIKSVCGMGLMRGVETEKPAAEILKACLAKGLVVLTAKNKVRLLPPLNIPMDLLEKGLAILAEACA